MNEKKSVFLGGPIHYATNKIGIFDRNVKKTIQYLVKNIQEAGFQIFLLIVMKISVFIHRHLIRKKLLNEITSG